MAKPTASVSRSALVMSLYLMLGAAGLVWCSLRGHSVWRVAGREEVAWLPGAALGLGIGLGIVFVSRLAVHHFEWARDFHRELRFLLGPLSDKEVLVLAGASSLGEELFFRGALLQTVGLGWSSLLFALLHIPPRMRFWPWTASALVAGLLFGQLFLWSGDLTGPVLAHFTVNFLNLRHLRDVELR